MRSYVGVLGVLGGFVLSIPRTAEALPPGGSQGSLSISLGGRIQRTEQLHESMGFVALTVPLDRFAGRQKVAIANERRSPDSDQERDQLQDNEPDAGRDFTDERSNESQVQAPPRVKRVAWLSKLAKRTVQMALVTAGLPRDTKRLESIASRARTSAVLPELAVRGMHSTDESLRLAPALDDSYRYTQTGGAGVTLEARMTWKLDRLVFADEELGVERIRSERARAEANLIERVARLFASWENSRLLLADPELTSKERRAVQVRALEAEVELDILTNGWFSEELAKSSEPPNDVPPRLAPPRAQVPAKTPKEAAEKRAEAPTSNARTEIAQVSPAKKPRKSKLARASDPE